MPKYFFDIESNDGALLPDAEGVDLPDASSAEAYASGLATTFPEDARDGEPDRVIVRDEAGRMVRFVSPNQGWYP